MIFFKSDDIFYFYFFKFIDLSFLFIINVKTFYVVVCFVEFVIIVFSSTCFGFAKIIYNTLTKLLNEDVFYSKELVKLALTSLMPKTKSEIKNQFFTGFLTRFMISNSSMRMLEHHL